MKRIAKNHSREHPRTCVFVDTECFRSNPNIDGTEGHLSFRLVCWRLVHHYGSSYNPDEMLHSTKRADFWSYLANLGKPKTVIWVFAHNLWFDLVQLGIKELFNDKRIRLTSAHRNCKAKTEGSCRKCRCWKGAVSLDTGASFASIMLDGRRINCIDSFNYFRSSLADIALAHNMQKGTLPADCASDEEWEEYCSNDVDICQTAMCELIKHWFTHDLGNFQFTGPGLAFSCYRHRFMNQSIVVHNNPEVRKDEQAAFYGGECTVFFKGRITQCKPDLFADNGYEQEKFAAYYVGPVWHIDVNSLYPHVMKENTFPAMYLGTHVSPTLSQVMDALSDYAVVAECLINTRERTYPFRYGERVWHPVGRFATHLCGPELYRAAINGDLERVYHMHIYERKRLFDEWVGFWNICKVQAAEAKNGAYYEFCKLLLNSLGGKFSQRNRAWRIDSRSTRIEEWGKWPRYLQSKREYQVCRALGRLVQVQDALQYADHALVAISAYITSYGRCHMAMARELVGENHVLYQDTDSLFVTDSGGEHLKRCGHIHATELGKFKIKEVILEGGIFGRQDYEADGRIVKAGLPRNAVQIGERRWAFDEFESAESMMSRLPDGTVRIKRAVMSGSELCSGRSYGADGRSVPRNAASIMREFGHAKE